MKQIGTIPKWNGVEQESIRNDLEEFGKPGHCWW